MQETSRKLRPPKTKKRFKKLLQFFVIEKLSTGPASAKDFEFEQNNSN